MISKKSWNRWLVFDRDEYYMLEHHFGAGGTLDMLMTPNETCALGQCCNADALKCLPILMKNGARPDAETWRTAFRLKRIDFVRSFIEHGFWPERKIAETIAETHYRHQRSWNCRDEVTKVLCRKAVTTALAIGKKHKQPLTHLWVMIAKKIWLSRHDIKWLDCLKEIV